MNVRANMNDRAKVFIVDDDDALRDALTMLLETFGYVVSAFRSATDFLASYTPGTCECIILDVSMPDMDGPSLQAELIRRGALLPVIFLSGYATIPLTVNAIKAGAENFLTKPVDGTTLLQQVRETLEKDALRNSTGPCQLAYSRLESLSEREREVLMLAISGCASKEIGKRLGISHRTAEVHRAHILQKTGVSNLLELANIVGMFESIQPPR